MMYCCYKDLLEQALKRRVSYLKRKSTIIAICVNETFCGEYKLNDEDFEKVCEMINKVYEDQRIFSISYIVKKLEERVREYGGDIKKIKVIDLVECLEFPW